MWRRQSSPYLLLLPALLVLGVLFLGGLAVAFEQSLGVMPALGRLSPTLDYVRIVLASREFWTGFGLTAYIALTATVLACAAGLLLAVGLAAAGSRSDTLLARLPLVVPHTVAAYLTMIWLSQSGLLARLAFRAGLIREPGGFPALVNDPYGLGIILTYVWKEAPFAALMLYPPLAAAGRGLLDAAATLGAGRLQRWRHVILPLVAPALGAVALIIFSYTFGAYEVPFLLGQTYPRTLPVAAVERFLSPDLADRPVAMVYNLVITLMTSAAVWLYLGRLAPRLERGKGT
ncbi:MAG TPA: spermidine/putrescine ABC transporter permease [Symbiobacteriaceae bacterium]|jgi:putative spermidine/putrescine transport system permease protein